MARNIIGRPKYISSVLSLKEENDYLGKKIEKSTITEVEKQAFLKRLKEMTIDWEKVASVPQILKKHFDNRIRKIIVFAKISNMRD